MSISGGPGTGKTVVALHRAAYLLYTDRRRYEGGGVLVVGPSGVFMRYIERVLPSLGETAVALRSLGEVVDGVQAARHDEPAVADLKGSARMAELMRRTARQPVPGAPTEFRVFWRDDVIRLDRGELGRLRRQLLSHGPRNRQLPAGRDRACSTPCGARSVASAAASGVARRSTTRCSPTRSSSTSPIEWWPPLAATDVFGWLRDPELPRPGRRGRADAGGAAAAVQVVARRPHRRPLGRGRAAARRAALPARRRPRPARDEQLDDELVAEGAVDLQELTTAADREYAPSGRAWAPPTTGSRTTATRTSWSTRRRT